MLSTARHAHLIIACDPHSEMPKSRNRSRPPAFDKSGGDSGRPVSCYRGVAERYANYQEPPSTGRNILHRPAKSKASKNFPHTLKEATQWNNQQSESKRKHRPLTYADNAEPDAQLVLVVDSFRPVNRGPPFYIHKGRTHRPLTWSHVLHNRQLSHYLECKSFANKASLPEDYCADNNASLDKHDQAYNQEDIKEYVQEDGEEDDQEGRQREDHVVELPDIDGEPRATVEEGGAMEQEPEEHIAAIDPEGWTKSVYQAVPDSEHGTQLIQVGASEQLPRFHINGPGLLFPEHTSVAEKEHSMPHRPHIQAKALFGLY
ncbi:hypothetical protein B0J12DRAFT_77768 [Macrophomina phaseolina]|uniref:Uncharacterized protein n=1 Tax=Macrophomina phaseolina TaxID=35725 RepID=A0ABQ8GBI6_9PEZI|nr:hypothetical protein B0J12DRAFT_77768 [Macrophomina phaseolina]